MGWVGGLGTGVMDCGFLALIRVTFMVPHGVPEHRFVGPWPMTPFASRLDLPEHVPAMPLSTATRESEYRMLHTTH